MMENKSTVYKREFNKETYDRIAVTVPKGQKAMIDTYAKSIGKSVNGLINDMLREALGKTIDEWRGGK